MNRRKILGLIGGVTSGFAGCLATGAGESGPDSPSPIPPATPSGTPPVNTRGLDEFDPTETYKNLDVGSRDGVAEDFRPHDLHIWNAGPEQRVVNLRILDRVANEPVHRATYTLPADDALAITVLEPSRYFVQLWGPKIATETLLVPCDLFDCNRSITSIGIFENGQIRSSVRSTLAGCPSPDC